MTFGGGTEDLKNRGTEPRKLSGEELSPESQNPSGSGEELSALEKGHILVSACLNPEAISGSKT